MDNITRQNPYYKKIWLQVTNSKWYSRDIIALFEDGICEFARYVSQKKSKWIPRFRNKNINCYGPEYKASLPTIGLPLTALISYQVKWEAAISFENRRNGKQTQVYYVTFHVRMAILHCLFPTQFFFHQFRQCKTEMRRLHILPVLPLMLNFLLDLLQPSTSSYYPSCELTFLPWICRQEVKLKLWYVSTKLHDVKPRK